MGLDKHKLTPCGFCFVVYYTREDTEDCCKVRRLLLAAAADGLAWAAAGWMCAGRAPPLPPRGSAPPRLALPCRAWRSPAAPIHIPSHPLPPPPPTLPTQYINGTMLDDRPIRVDFDWGFVEGRQFGRGRSGGQVRRAPARARLRQLGLSAGAGAGSATAAGEPGRLLVVLQPPPPPSPSPPTHLLTTMLAFPSPLPPPQVRDEYRMDFDAGRGGYGSILQKEMEVGAGSGGTAAAAATATELRGVELAEAGVRACQACCGAFPLPAAARSKLALPRCAAPRPCLVARRARR